ncbi:LytR C-terminal domain-containing protein [Bifidobacterium sp. 64T4]|uniref:LytR C-terminal domain-containing protein n=1 Tax=Bifidobacterium pongonis TaxID=2834432 RepID=UPI001C59148A|nr:LytR C-terminal domain-containing protein [Bifidobacterium pongonis]MBW3094857.1 LytR C-terminal domain-containing protein [Bifidobacterium pongonis]
MTEPYDERAARKAYMRRRQTTVFTITAVILVVALVVSCLVSFKVITFETNTKTVAQPNYGQAVPCAAKNSDGSAMKWADNNTVPVRVRNGTEFAGLAKAVGEALQDRQFNVVTIDNYPSSKVNRTTIYFGVNAINPAYTLNAYFKDAVMVMDDRQDRLVDVVLGATFNDLNKERDVKKQGDTIKDFEGCKTVDEMNKLGLPKASEHTAVN